METMPAAGWYPDPAGEHAGRWWDGARWSNWVHTGNGEVVDASALPTVATRTGVGMALLWALVGLVLGLVAGAILVAIVAVPTAGAAEDAWVAAASTLGLGIGFSWTAWYVARREGTSDLVAHWRIQFRWRDLWTGLGQALLARLLSGVVAIALVVVLGIDIDDTNPQTQDVEGSMVALVGFGVAAVLFAPFFEELLFRGVLLRSFVARLGTGWGVVLGAIPFGLLHIIPGAGWEWAVLLAVQTYVLGVLLGRLAVRSGRLGPPIATHAIFNLTTVVLIGIAM